MADLRRENAQLKRLVSRLRKDVERLESLTEGLEVETLPRPKRAKAATCPECDSADLMLYETPGGKKLSICRSCSARTPIAA